MRRTYDDRGRLVMDVFDIMKTCEINARYDALCWLQYGNAVYPECSLYFAEIVFYVATLPVSWAVYALSKLLLFVLKRIFKTDEETITRTLRWYSGFVRSGGEVSDDQPSGLVDVASYAASVVNSMEAEE